MTIPSDLDIARSVTPRRIVDVAADLGLTQADIELYGPVKAKVSLKAIERLEAQNARGKYILVTAITPTPLGEGKTTTTVGLAQGLNLIGKRAAVAIRQPSLGPVFGIKGGAAGGGHSQVIPMEDFNLHLTGDVHAIGAAHNLAAAFIDNSLHHKNPLGIDPFTIAWPRVVDISDRAIRRMVIGLGGRENGVPRETETVITVASEVMAILALARDLPDLRARLGRIVLAQTTDGRPVTAEDLKVAGAMTALLRSMRSSRTCSRRSRAARPSSTAGRSRTSPTATTRSWPTGWRWRRTRWSAPRPASEPTWAPRSSSTSSAAPRACDPTRR